MKLRAEKTIHLGGDADGQGEGEALAVTVREITVAHAREMYEVMLRIGAGFLGVESDKESPSVDAIEQWTLGAGKQRIKLLNEVCTFTDGITAEDLNFEQFDEVWSQFMAVNTSFFKRTGALIHLRLQQQTGNVLSAPESSDAGQTTP